MFSSFEDSTIARGLQKIRSALAGNFRYATTWVTVSNTINAVSQFLSASDTSGNVTVGYLGSGASGYLVLPVNGQPITKQKLVTATSYGPYFSYIENSSTGYFGGTQSSNSCIAVHKVNLSTDTVSATATVLPGSGYQSFIYPGNYRSFGTDSSGNMYFNGYISPSTGGEYRTGIFKFNSSGTLQWSSVYGRGINSAQTIMYGGTAVAPSGNTYHAGVTTNAVTSTGCVIKLNSSGTLQWQYNITSQDYHRNIVIDSSENVYIITYSSTVSGYACIIKLDSNGNLVSQRRVNAYIYDIYVDQSTNDIYLAGAGTASGTAFVCKYNSSLTLQWQRTISASINSLYFNSVTLSNSRLYLGTYYRIASGGTTKRAIIKLLADGSGTGTFVLDDATFTYGTSSITETSSNETRSALTLTSYSVTFSNPSITPSISDTNISIGYSPIPT